MTIQDLAEQNRYETVENNIEPCQNLIQPFFKPFYHKTQCMSIPLSGSLLPQKPLLLIQAPYSLNPKPYTPPEVDSQASWASALLNVQLHCRPSVSGLGLRFGCFWCLGASVLTAGCRCPSGSRFGAFSGFSVLGPLPRSVVSSRWRTVYIAPYEL